MSQQKISTSKINYLAKPKVIDTKPCWNKATTGIVKSLLPVPDKAKIEQVRKVTTNKPNYLPTTLRSTRESTSKVPSLTSLRSPIKQSSISLLNNLSNKVEKKVVETPTKQNCKQETRIKIDDEIEIIKNFTTNKTTINFCPYMANFIKSKFFFANFAK